VTLLYSVLCLTESTSCIIDPCRIQKYIKIKKTIKINYRNTHIEILLSTYFEFNFNERVFVICTSARVHCSSVPTDARHYKWRLVFVKIIQNQIIK